MFSTFDINLGCWQVEIDDDGWGKCFHIASRPIQIFKKANWTVPPSWHISTSDGYYIIANKMEICPCVPRRYYHIYRNTAERISHFCIALSLLHEAGVTLNLKKCTILTEKTDSLGHVIQPGRSELADHTIDKIREFETAAKRNEVEIFSLIMTLYRRFGRNSAHIPAPLSKRLKKG